MNIQGELLALLDAIFSRTWLAQSDIGHQESALTREQDSALELNILKHERKGSLLC